MHKCVFTHQGFTCSEFSDDYEGAMCTECKIRGLISTMKENQYASKAPKPTAKVYLLPPLEKRGRKDPVWFPLR